MVTDSNGNVTARYDYMPFGQELLAGTGGRTAGQGFSSMPDAFEMKYTGQVRDPETQLDYMNARYYDPAQGRFQAMDPGNAGANGEIPQTWNGFAYVNNSPLNNTDPSGQFVAIAAGSGAGPIGTIIGGLIDLGLLFGDLFGGGGGTPPKPDWSTTVWGTSQTQTTQVSGTGSAAGIAADVGIAVLPGILASVTGTAKAPNKSLKQKVCSALPSGRTVGVSGGLGGVGSVGGGGEVVINYNSGQVSAFGFGGVQVGWNGGASGSVYTGLVYGLNGSNSNYSGGFTGVNGGAGFGGFAARSSGGLTGGAGGLLPTSGVTAAGVSFGGGLLSGAAGGFSATNYTNPFQFGSKLSAAIIGLSPIDSLLYAAAQVCK